MSRSKEDIRADIIYDEARVPHYQVPNVLGKPGHLATTAMDWVSWRRAEVLELYRSKVFGQTPPRPDHMSFELLSCREGVLGGLGQRREYRIRLSMSNGRSFSFVMLLYLPVTASCDHPVPCFLGLNFRGNHTTTPETDVLMTGAANPGNNYQDEASRGYSQELWQIPETLRRGFATATICYHDILPDYETLEAFPHSALSLFLDDEGMSRCHERYTAIGVWAWGLSRGMDCLEAIPVIDPQRVCVHGLSRLGKTALWAGATDRRFPMVVSVCSGCGGAALFRRCFGESTEWIYDMAPSWFLKDFEAYVCHEDDMPFDQHFLIALSAPRKVCVFSAEEDLWADPRGEFESTRLASPVYRLFGSEGLPGTAMPAVGQRVTGDLSYHIRAGVHSQTREDWEHMWEVAGRL